MSTAVIDSRMSAELKDALRSYADKLIPLPPFERLSAPVASHSDMLIWRYGKTVITYREYYAKAREQFLQIEKLGYGTVICDEPVSDKYPHDIALNCALVGNKILANGNFVSSEIRNIANENGFEIIHTKQGYAKCSCVCISDSAIITADPSIARAASSAGIDVLKITPEHVRLDGYGTGFIGGASGVTQDAVLFCGNIDTHPDASAIKEFCRKHGKTAVSLSNDELYDYGTVIFL